MKCKNPQCDNEVSHDMIHRCIGVCFDCYTNTAPTPQTMPLCAHKNCNQPRLTISRFCTLHYDEARAIATGEGYDAVPNITVFAETPEALATSLKHYSSMGYVEIQNPLGRRVGEGVEMRYVRQSPADDPGKDTACTTGPLTATEILRLRQENDARLQSDIQAMQQGNKTEVMIKARNKTEECEHPGCDYLRALHQRYCPVHMPVESIFAKAANKRADRNQFAAPHHDGAAMKAPDDWIKCSERIPECRGEFLVYEVLNNRVQHDYWIPDDCAALEIGFWNHYGTNVTHWMPLPAAPKPESE